MASGFLKLPVELIVLILLELSGWDLEAVQLVSRASKQAVEQSVALSYKLSCFRAGVFDGSPTAPYTVVRRAEILSKWREARSQGMWDGPTTTLRIEDAPSISGPLWMSHKLDSQDWTDIHFQQIPSMLRGLESKSWTLRDVRESDRSSKIAAKCDYYQDLLVVVEGFPSTERAQLRFLTCSTGEPHPGAQEDTIEFDLPNPIPEYFTLIICGDIVGIEGRPSDEMSPEIWVFNWRQGRCLLNVAYIGEDDILEAGLEIHGFALLDSRHALITTGGEASRQFLIILDCYRTPSHQIMVHEAAYEHAALVLVLPAARTDLEGRIVSHQVYCTPVSPEPTYGLGVNVPFRLSDRSPVVFFTTQVFPPTGQSNTMSNVFVHVVPSRAIFSRLIAGAAGPANILRPSWSEWEQDTFLMNTRKIPMMEYPYCLGSTFARTGSVKRSNGSIRNVVKLYDLRPVSSSMVNPLEVEEDTDILASDAPLPHAAYARARTDYYDDYVCDHSRCDHFLCVNSIWDQPMTTGKFVFKTIWADVELVGGDLGLLEDGVMIYSHSTEAAKIYTL